jgi:hypothetical protein
MSRARPEASIIAPLSSLSIIWPVILGTTVLHESMNEKKIIAILMVLVAVLLMGVNFGALKNLVCGGTSSGGDEEKTEEALSMMPLAEMPEAAQESVVDQESEA